MVNARTMRIRLLTLPSARRGRSVDIDQVLAAFEHSGLRVHPGKCHFLKRKVKYLGKIVSASGVTPDPCKITAIQNLLPPTTITGVRLFVGAVSYYRRWTQGFGNIAAPLHSLTRKDQKFVWTAVHQDAWETLKNLLSRLILLSLGVSVCDALPS